MLLKKLTDACGLPGFEDEVQEIIKKELDAIGVTYSEDRIGNIIAVKNPEASGKVIALSAHMDEAGLCVKSVDSKGLLKFVTWGVDNKILLSQRVLVGAKKTPGVIGSKPIHLQKPSERSVPVEIDAMYIDIGANSKEEAEKLVNPGDFAAFDSSWKEFGEGKIKAKALDDRLGCAAILEILKKDYKNKIIGVFVTQEEVGLRGSAVAAKSLKTDLVINIEGTICADFGETKKREQVTALGAGPSISLMDLGSIYQRKYIDQITKIAEENKIPYQYRRGGKGGTDAKNYHEAQTGTPVIGLAVPCRYIHSPVSVADMSDYENLIKLIDAYLNKREAGAE